MLEVGFFTGLIIGGGSVGSIASAIFVIYYKKYVVPNAKNNVENNVENENLRQDYIEIQAENKNLIIERDNLRENSINEGKEKVCLSTEKESLSKELLRARDNENELRQKIDGLVQNISQKTQELATSEEKRNSTKREMEIKEQNFQENKDKFSIEFTNLANNIFDEKSNSFRKQSEEKINIILNPLKNNIDSYQNEIKEFAKNQNDKQIELKKEIESIVTINNSLTLEAKNLTKALQGGDSKAQGDWGEILLERVLEYAGLQKDIHYILQGVGMGLKNDVTDKAEKPDVIIKLPENKHIIIDAKTSLTHYIQYIETEEKEMKKIHLKDLKKAVREQIDDLAIKNYQSNKKLNTVNLVLMFIPNEAAYYLLMQEDRDLYDYAFKKQVVLVTQSNLFAMLKTIASIWKMEGQNKNAKKIAETGKRLYDKIKKFVGDMEKIGKQIDATKKTYEGAMTTLKGQAGIIFQTQQLDKLGVEPKEKISQEILDDVDIGNTQSLFGQQNLEQVKVTDATETETETETETGTK